MKAFGTTDIGKVRRSNQDTFSVQMLPGAVLALVCDGMGGAAAGQVASKLACDTFVSHAVPAIEASRGTKIAESLRDAADLANREVYFRSLEDRDCEGMGTTLVAIYMTESTATLINVGDSAAYRFSDGKLRKITHDHSLVQEMVDSGKISPEEAKNHPRKNVITRVVGGEIQLRSDMFEVGVQPHDLFLLCSDGLTNALTEETISHILSSGTEPDKICRTLIDRALENNARDNVTAVVLTPDKEADLHE